MKRLIYYILLSTLLVIFYLSIMTILDIMVSLKYETDDCISGITGKNLCFLLRLWQTISVLSIGSFITLIIFRQKIVKRKTLAGRD
jgi:hypothetical protein